jgi:AcrR family transcriptional regulator
MLREGETNGMVATTASGIARRVQSEAVRREQILTSMRQLIGEQGYDRTTTAQIARRAGISEGTIYNYFPSKGMILRALAEQAQRMTMERAFSRAVPGLQGGALIRAMLEGAFEAAHEHEDLMRAFALNVDFQDPNQPGRICTTAEADAESLADLTAFLQGQQETGLIPRSVNVPVAARLIFGTVNQAMNDCICGTHGEDETAYIDLMVRMFSRTLYVE